MFRFHGVLQLDRLPALIPDPLPIRCEDNARTLELPGITLRWTRGSLQVAHANGLLVAASGRARGLTAEARDEATRWADELSRFGDGALAAASGGFTVVALDVRARTAKIGVDRFGIEALCYATGGASLAFSNGALYVPGSRGELDPQALYDYLYFHMIPAPATVFRDVRRLEAAHVLTVSTGGARVRRYWTPRFVEDDTRNLEERKRRFVELVEQAVAEEADEPATACFLSGGTDSSTIAGMLTRLRGEPAHAYSIGFDARGYDEMEYARIAARHFGLVHHEYYLTPDDVVDAIPRLGASIDQPFGNSSVLPAFVCASRARSDGFSRMLAGDGGDELFGGNVRYARQKLFEAYHGLPHALRARVLEPAAHSRLFINVPGLRQMGGYVRYAHPPMPDRLESFNLLTHLGGDALLDPSFRARIDAGQPRAQQRATWHAIDGASLVNRMLVYDWKYTLADNDLPKVRYAADLAGVCIGYPLLSCALAEFSLALPPQWKLRGLRLRWFFKQALRQFLPPQILRKKKHGFGMPFGDWLLQHARLRELASDLLEGVARRGVIQPSFARALLASRLAEAPGYYGEMAWILIMLEQWLRAHEAALRPARG